MVLVTLGTGIGGGLIVGDELVRGAAGFAGEPGHMVVDPNGPPCPCGRRGCWERYASGSGLGRLGREAAEAGRAGAVVALAGGDPEAVRGEHVTAAAAGGDPEALAVMADFAWWVALGMANLVNLLDPEVVIIGGGLAEAGELLLGPTRAAFETWCWPPSTARRSGSWPPSWAPRPAPSAPACWPPTPSSTLAKPLGRRIDTVARRRSRAERVRGVRSERVGSGFRRKRGPGYRGQPWSSAGSTGCRPTSSPSSTR